MASSAKSPSQYRTLISGETGEKINQNLTANLEAQHMDRGSSGCGDSLESNPELDALSKMVVDKVLEKIKADPKGQLKLVNGSGNR